MHDRNATTPLPPGQYFCLWEKNGLRGPSEGGHIERARGQITRRNSASSSQTNAGGGALVSFKFRACGKSSNLPVSYGSIFWPRGGKRPRGRLILHSSTFTFRRLHRCLTSEKGALHGAHRIIASKKYIRHAVNAALRYPIREYKYRAPSVGKHISNKVSTIAMSHDTGNKSTRVPTMNHRQIIWSDTNFGADSEQRWSMNSQILGSECKRLHIGSQFNHLQK